MKTYNSTWTRTSRCISTRTGRRVWAPGVRLGGGGARALSAWRTGWLATAALSAMSAMTACGGAGDGGSTGPSASRVAAVRVTANRAATIDEHGHVLLAGQAQTAAGVAVPGLVLTWGTPDTAVVRVSGAGEVTAVAPGTARVVASLPATVSGAVLADTATVTVTALPVAAVALADSALPAGVAVGETAALAAEPRAADGLVLPLTPARAVTWSSSDAAVATVAATADGRAVVTARALGTAVVTAASGGGIATTTVRVVAAPLRFVVTADAGVPETLVAAVRIAARRWEHLVVRGSGAAPDPRDTGCDVLAGLAPGQYPVRVRVVSFGPGQSGAEATLCNRADYQPAAAEIRLDTSLTAAGAADRATATAAHEMGHGFNLGGWTYGRPGPMIDSARTVFTGPRAAAAWQALGGSGFAPLQVGPPAPAAHWSRTGGLCGDLMNPIPVAASAISAVSLGALVDLGWTVAPERAEPLPRTGCA